MADRPISITIRGAVPNKLICPSCSAQINVPEKTGNSPMYQVTLNCACDKTIFLRCLTHGN